MPFDARLNTSRMVAHFKKCAIESLSFEFGVREAELESFFRVFSDQKKYAKADEISDRVITQLVKEEYKKGAISVQRLGHILRRLIPDSRDMQRLCYYSLDF